MVQKQARPAAQSPPRPRGRPRAYEPETALTKAMETFWRDGFAATSLDDLSAATGMNRPSLYGAFGDKRALYIQAYRHYRRRVREAFRPMFFGDVPLRDKLRRILAAAVDLYSSGEAGPRGCFTVLTTSSDAIADAEIRVLVGEAIDDTDAALAGLFGGAVKAGELPAEADPARLGRLAAATLHTLSIRARAGAARAALDLIVEDAVETICGGPPVSPSPKARPLSKPKSRPA
jgi:TetR/AcrR family transcriptional regulator, copper-responsive repressor